MFSSVVVQNNPGKLERTVEDKTREGDGEKKDDDGQSLHADRPGSFRQVDQFFPA